MARSQTIWLVMDEESSRNPVEPIAAFTVKHELKTWLDHNRWQWDSIRLFRCPDKPHWAHEYYEAPVEMDIGEVMK